MSSLQICPTFANFQFGKTQHYDEDEIDLEGGLEPFSDDEVPDFAGNDDYEANIQMQEQNLMEEIGGQPLEYDDDGDAFSGTTISHEQRSKVKKQDIFSSLATNGSFSNDDD